MMTRMRHSVLALAVLASGVAAAQTPDRGVPGRIMDRLVARLRTDRSIPDSLRHFTAAELMGPANVQFVRTFDDTAAADFEHVMAATLSAIPDSMCGGMVAGSGDSPDLPQMLPFVDSTTATQWSVILDHLVHARAAHAAEGRAAGTNEIKDAYLAMISQLPSADRDRLSEIGHAAQHTPADLCWVTRVTTNGLARLPAARLAPVVRGMFGGKPAGE